jgi:hypothetical protein
MTERLTDGWRRQVAEQEAAVAAGTLAPDEADAAAAWPPEFIAAVDAAMAPFERTVAALGPAPADEAVWAAVQQVVEALNDVEGQVDTITREELCEGIEKVVAAAGVDVSALLIRRRGEDRSDLTDEWRDW